MGIGGAGVDGKFKREHMCTIKGGGGRGDNSSTDLCGQVKV